MQFDNLKSTLIQLRRLKMKGAIKKANSWNNCDMKLDEQEDIIVDTGKLPKFLDKK